MGRRDSLSASKEAANNNIPAPNSTVDVLLDKFHNVGLTLNDMVALSGILLLPFVHRMFIVSSARKIHTDRYSDTM